MNYSKEHAAYLRAIRTHGWTVGLCRILVLVLLLGFWELGARLGWFDVFILSSPSRVLSAIGRLWGEGSLLIHVGVTLYETIMGFLRELDGVPETRVLRSTPVTTAIFAPGSKTTVAWAAGAPPASLPM